jgi:Dyp-type peroxidase family
MTLQLDLADIQGNILQDFGSGFPKARFIFLHIPNDRAAEGRKFVMDYRSKVTSALRWDSRATYPGEITQNKPPVAINIAFTWRGLLALDLPHRTLAKMPPEFIDGMAARAAILGDAPIPSEKMDTRPPQNWDAIWRDLDLPVHVMIGLNAQMDSATGQAVPELEAETGALCELCDKYGLIRLKGHGPELAPFQDGSLLLHRKADGSFEGTNKEHFGFSDGFGNPAFEGQGSDNGTAFAVGGGKITRQGKGTQWDLLATGEFLLGHPDEAEETPDTAAPFSFIRNGTFLVYRKLHENVGSFRGFIEDMAKQYSSMMQITAEDSAEIIKAKMIGRWSDGVPLMAAPTIEDWREFKKRPDGPEKYKALVDFKYAEDREGLKCPVTAHMRRANTRDMLDPGGESTNATSALNNRRRILRRGIPYGPTELGAQDDQGEHGIIFLALCASINRQFEFVQQQWMQYGLDFNAGSDTCPVVGNHAGNAKFVIPADPKSGHAPFIASNIPQFVETRGGDYFFLPSMTALRMLGMGVVDPT